MSDKSNEIIAKIHSLRILVPETWNGGPYDSGEMASAESRLRRSFDPAHRRVLEQIGGNFTFEVGAVSVAGNDRDVRLFLGLGSPYDIIEEWEIYQGQIPECWYPFAKDMDGHLYVLTKNGYVYHVTLEEELWTRTARPANAGQRVATSFSEFAMSLCLPDWAIAHFSEEVS